MKKQKDKQTTITPTEEYTYFYLSDTRQRNRSVAHITDVITRWLERSTRRKNRHINKPSIRIETQYDPSLRQTVWLAYAYSFPDTLPDWLRTTKIGKEETKIEIEE